MTNRERWNSYTSGLSSPQNFIDWSFRFVIGAALQRRVAFGGCPKYGHMPLFPNIYTILVGRAGVGKGIVIGPATDLLKFHKQKDFLNDNDTAEMDDQMKLITQKVNQANNEDAEATTQKLKRGGEKIDPPLFPYAPDATTYEKLVEDMGDAFRRINFVVEDESGNKKIDIYGHCSMYFSLPELASLMRKRTEDTVNYLLGLYDCPLDYEYKTKTQGKDRVRRGCLNILAGTTPEFMETIFDQQLIDQGFSSRVFFIYGAKNRKHVFMPEPLTKEQIEYRKELLKHVKKLARLYGQVTVDPSTMEYLSKWWHDYQENRGRNLVPKLEPFEARMNIHVIKIAMIEHFMESTDMHIPLERFTDAIAILEKEKLTMAQALNFDGDNPLAKVTEKIEMYIATKKEVAQVDILTEFWKQLPEGKESLEKILVHLITVGKIEEGQKKDPITHKVKITYKPMRQI